jgi:hypothetical protein
MRSEPNGGNRQNCAAIFRGLKLLDFSCETPIGTACYIKPFVPLSIRGLGGLPATGPAIDERYVFVVDESCSSKSFFRGYGDTDIICNSSSSNDSSISSWKVFNNILTNLRNQIYKSWYIS